MTTAPVKPPFKQSFLYGFVTISAVIVSINTLVIAALFLAQQQWAMALTTTQSILLSTLLICLVLTPLIHFFLLKPLRLEVSQLQTHFDEKTHENQQLFEALDDYAPISLSDLSGRIIYANTWFCEITGYSERELLQQEHNIINLNYQDPKFMRPVWRTLNQGEAWKGDVCDSTKQGRIYWVDNTLIRMYGPDGRPKQYIAIRRDATQAKKNEANQLVLQHLLNTNTDMLMITDATGYITTINSTLAHFSGWQQEQLIGQLPEIMSSPYTDANKLAEMQQSLQQGQAWNGRLLNLYHKQLSDSGEPAEYWVEIDITPLYSPKNEFIGCLQVQQDITAAVLKEQSLLLENADNAVYLEIVSILQQALPLKIRFTLALDCLMHLKGLGRQINGMIKGGIYLKEPDKDQLQLWVLQGEFSDDFMHHEQELAMGAGLFGETVTSQKLKIANECFCDLHYEAVSDDMKTHGHYLVPIVLEGNTLGLLFLYTQRYPVEAPSRLNLLQQVSDLLAASLVQESTHPLLTTP